MAGIQVRYRIVGGEEPPPPPMPAPEPEPKPAPPPIVEVPVTPTERPVVITSLSTSPLEINETVVTQTFPLLPYLFFDAGKADLRARYRSDEPTQGFSEQTLPKQTLPIYYRMLDIVGKRMQRQEGVVLTVTGTADDTEAYADADLRQLATRRARAVVDYMRDRWGLPEDRFRVTTAERPSLPSNEAYAEGLEENRRVEITASDASLLAPVVHSRFLEFVPTQPMHEFTVATRNPELASSWDLEVRRGGTLVGWKRGTGAPPNVRFDLTQEITDRLGPVIGPVDTLDATIIVQQTNAAPVQATTRFPLRKTVSNFEVSRLSLIVFDYDQATISPVNQQMMRYVIMQSAGQGSTASIKGSTDRLGELRYNVNLSTDRARAVEAYLRSVAPQVSIDSVTGVGPADLPYDNSLPEGRFYCRTVSLTITTPLR
jgi:outer membrane protein OmpA-like peptidoglycan-associated protein